MDSVEKQQIFDHAKEWTLEAGERIKAQLDKPFKVNTKKDRKDLVTEVDEDTERFFAERIRSTYPNHQVLGEEGLGDNVTSLDGIVWIIDPIDGTMNFVHQQRHFAISVGLYKDGEGIFGLIYNVMTDDLYVAKRGEGAHKNGVLLPKLDQSRKLEDSLLALNHYWSIPNRRFDEKGIHELVRKVRGTRTFGSAALEFAFVAEGIIDGYMTMRLAPWDIAAGIILVNEVGGVTSRVDGSPLNMLKENSVITCNSAIQEEIVNNYIRKK
ncbi:inositol monophosphatase family protein [Salinibacillus xinjiangensis]|uniref:inositol-phosphate phosphatase n=1 Tax=Salinibacillus xinjiangensis TaxID=1229268 RepID=A0A6G1X3R4_9BACI|nr:inositol monophosphatase family protein [Salinibacillus xinjiangensis]MRG85546.1 inositol monophosphatase [Salinibacillus xinjiangensis]